MATKKRWKVTQATIEGRIARLTLECGHVVERSAPPALVGRRGRPVKRHTPAFVRSCGACEREDR